jgi:ankyrin repeat protein
MIKSSRPHPSSSLHSIVPLLLFLFFYSFFLPLVHGFHLKSTGARASSIFPPPPPLSLELLIETNHEIAAVTFLSRLQQGDHPNHIDFINELSPLCYASSSKNFPLAAFLLTAGADANDARCRNGWTPLMFAATASASPTIASADQSTVSVSLVELLLSHGADPFHLSDDAFSPYHLSSDERISQILERAIQSSPNSQQFLTAQGTISLILPVAAKMPKLTLQSLLTSSLHSTRDQWRDPNERSLSLQTPLMLAARAGLAQNMKLLIEAGADVNLRDANGWTALMHSFASVSSSLCLSLSLTLLSLRTVSSVWTLSSTPMP